MGKVRRPTVDSLLHPFELRTDPSRLLARHSLRGREHPANGLRRRPLQARSANWRSRPDRDRYRSHQPGKGHAHHRRHHAGCRAGRDRRGAQRAGKVCAALALLHAHQELMNAQAGRCRSGEEFVQEAQSEEGQHARSCDASRDQDLACDRLISAFTTNTRSTLAVLVVHPNAYSNHFLCTR